MSSGCEVRVCCGNSACAGWEDLRGEIDDLLQLAWLFVAVIRALYDPDRKIVFSCEAEFAVWVVFENDEVILAGKSINSLALCKRHSFACRVLEIRDEVEELYVLFGLESVFELFKVDTVIFHFDALEVNVV